MKLVMHFTPSNPDSTQDGRRRQRIPRRGRHHAFSVKFYQIQAIETKGKPEHEWPGWWHRDVATIKIRCMPERYIEVCREIARSGNPAQYHNRTF